MLFGGERGFDRVFRNKSAELAHEYFKRCLNGGKICFLRKRFFIDVQRPIDLDLERVKRADRSAVMFQDEAA